MDFLRHRVWAFLVLGFLSTAFWGCSDSGSSTSTDAVNVANRVYMIRAEEGVLSQAASALSTGENDNAYVLTLNNVIPETLWYTDRPERESGEDTLTYFFEHVWSAAYGRTDPNAVVKFSVSGANGGVFATLKDPAYDSTARTLTFIANLINYTFDTPPETLLVFEEPVVTILNNVSGENEGSSFVQHSQYASFESTGTEGQYTLSLNDTDAWVLWANNAPGRYSHTSSPQYFKEHWNSQFSDSAPNACLFGNGENGEFAAYLLVLESPNYDMNSNRFTYTATLFGAQTEMPATLDSPSLVIDAADGVKTVWKVDPKTLQVSVNGTPIKLKGVAYSPSGINKNSNNFGGLGDFFWDTYDTGGGNKLYNWYALWGYGQLDKPSHQARDDLKTIRNLGANSIRTYYMMSRQGPSDSSGAIPAPGTGHQFTHKQFLDKCYNGGKNPLYVMAGIPMPDVCFQKTAYDANPAESNKKVLFWEYLLNETTTEIANHPAVLGFTIMNELDNMPSAFPNTGDGPPDKHTDYFYGNSKKYADTIKGNAGDKLVGWGLHDVPQLIWFASQNPTSGKTYLEQLSSFDFYGVNTYQTQSYDSVLGSKDQNGNVRPYGKLTGNMRKPVIFTEFGWPATGRNPDGAGTPDGDIQESAKTRQNTADLVTKMLTSAFGYDIFMGVFYFEFSDEWYKSDQAAVWNKTPGLSPNNFPNKFWDEEGFGLFSCRRGDGLSNTDSVWGTNGPMLPVDVLTERTEITTALKAIYVKNK